MQRATVVLSSVREHLSIVITDLRGEHYSSSGSDLLWALLFQVHVLCRQVLNCIDPRQYNVIVGRHVI